MGVPGWPEFAFCTASIASVRMVSMQRRSREELLDLAGEATPPGRGDV